MAHNILEDRYIGAEPAWHKIGTYPGRTVTAQEAIVATRADYRVEKEPLRIVGSVIIKQMATVRADLPKNDPMRHLGIVGPDYEVLQNTKAFGFFDAVVDSDAAIFESVGILGRGEEMFIVARLPEREFWVKDDEHRCYITLTNGHTGRHGVRIFTTMVRVVCQNTLTVALRNVRKMVTLRHTKNVESRLRQAPLLLGLADKQFQATQAIFQQLAATRIPAPPMFQAWVEDVFPSAGESPNSRTLGHRDEVKRLMNADKQNTPGVAGTFYAAYQALAQYVDHGFERYAGLKQDEHRAVQALFGRGNDLKARALKITETHAKMYRS